MTYLCWIETATQLKMDGGWLRPLILRVEVGELRTKAVEMLNELPLTNALLIVLMLWHPAEVWALSLCS